MYHRIIMKLNSSARDSIQMYKKKPEWHSVERIWPFMSQIKTSRKR